MTRLRSVVASGETAHAAWRVVGLAEHPDAPVDSGAKTLRLEPIELIHFTFELHTALAAGLPLVDTVHDFGQQEPSGRRRRICLSLADRMFAGSSFSDALKAHPKAFPPIYAELISVAELTGKLEETLVDLEQYLAWQLKVRGQIAEVARYPIIFFGAVAGLWLLLMTCVMPWFLESVRLNWNFDLPLSTRAMLWMDWVLHKRWPSLVVLSLASTALYRSFLLLPRPRLLIDKMKLAIPLLGPLQQEILLSRVTHNLASMLDAGLDLVTALTRCESLTDNHDLQQRMRTVRIGVQNGRSFSRMLKRTGLGSSMVIRLVALGETTGRLSQLLRKVSWHYDRQLPQLIAVMIATLTPLTLLLMAATVEFMASAILQPTYTTICSMK